MKSPHGVTQAKPPSDWLSRVGSLVLLGASLLAGCTTTPPGGRPDLLAFLADDRTSRQDVLLNLGGPSEEFEGGKIFAYRLGFDSRNQGYFVARTKFQPVGLEAYFSTEESASDATSSSSWPTWKGIKYSLVLVFNDQGVLCRHSLVEVNL